MQACLVARDGGRVRACDDEMKQLAKDEDEQSDTEIHLKNRLDALEQVLKLSHGRVDWIMGTGISEAVPMDIDPVAAHGDQISSEGRADLLCESQLKLACQQLAHQSTELQELKNRVRQEQEQVGSLQQQLGQRSYA